MARVILIIVFAGAVCMTAIAAMNKDYFTGSRNPAKSTKSPIQQSAPESHGSVPGDCPGCPLPTN